MPVGCICSFVRSFVRAFVRSSSNEMYDYLLRTNDWTQKHNFFANICTLTCYLRLQIFIQIFNVNSVGQGECHAHLIVNISKTETDRKTLKVSKYIGNIFCLIVVAYAHITAESLSQCLLRLILLIQLSSQLMYWNI